MDSDAAGPPDLSGGASSFLPIDAKGADSQLSDDGTRWLVTNESFARPPFKTPQFSLYDVETRRRLGDSFSFLQYSWLGRFSPGSSFLLFADEPGTAVFDARTGQKVSKLGTRVFAFSPDDRKVALYSYFNDQHYLKICDAPAAAHCTNLWAPATKDHLTRLTFTPNGRFLIALTDQGFVWKIRAQ